jgi:hypothetical protein
MKIIENYDQLDISPLQSTRLYLQGRPLLSLWSRKRRGVTINCPRVIELIESELTEDFVAVDCAGWYFDNPSRHCTAIELMPQSAQYWSHVHFEYDYLTWHPDYLCYNQPVLAYYSTYFKYCELDEFLNFCKIWADAHTKLIIGLDPTKIKYNYFKWDLLEIISSQLADYRIQLLDRTYFNLLFTIENS